MTDTPNMEYGDLAKLFGCSVDTVKRSMAQWRKDGFPAALPWSHRPLRWHRAAVLAWKERRERATNAVPHDLRSLQGGRG